MVRGDKMAIKTPGLFQPPTFPYTSSFTERSREGDDVTGCHLRKTKDHHKTLLVWTTRILNTAGSCLKMQIDWGLAIPLLYQISFYILCFET